MTAVCVYVCVCEFVIRFMLFDCLIVAEELLRKKKVCYKDDEMLVSLYNRVNEHEDISSADVTTTAAAAVDAAACDQSDVILVKVSDIPLDMTEAVVHMLFENKRYGGGNIKTFEFCRSDSSAVIEFESLTGNMHTCTHTHFL